MDGATLTAGNPAPSASAFLSGAGSAPRAATVVTPTYQGPYSNTTILGEPMGVWVGAIALLALWRLLGRSNAIPGEPQNIRINGYNVIAVTLAASIGIIMLKATFNLWKLPGITEFVNAL